VAFVGQVLALSALVLLQFPGVQRDRPGARDSAAGLIVGQVIDADSGRPLRGTVVVLAGPSRSGGAPHPRILTGDDGRFVYRGLRRGNYNIYAYKPGYVEGAHGRRRPAGPAVPLPLADGQRTDDAVILLWKHAAISGTVVDEAGERLIGVRVQAYRRTVISGRRRYVPSAAALTDDRGIYRVGALIPGDYIVGAVARQDPIPVIRRLAATRDGGLGRAPEGEAPEARRGGDVGSLLGLGAATPPPGRDGRFFVYPPIFHPNAPSGDAASVISLRAGAEYVSADLQLAPVPTVSVSGYIVGPDGPVMSTPVRLVASNTAEITLDADAISAMTDRAGRFTFPAVPSGHYFLRMRRGASPASSRIQSAPNTVLWTDLPVNVGIEDVENLMVEAQPGIRIGGRVEFEGRSPGSGAVVVSIEPADAVSAALGADGVAVRADQYGEFQSPPLPGGRYYVRVPNSPGGWMFKSATSDGRDVVDTPMNVTGDELNVVVTFTDRWSGLNGFVQNRQGLDAAAAVLVFPTDSDTWVSSGNNPRRVRSIRTGRTGEYSVNLPPGDYYVIAVPEAQTAGWQDPAFLDSASRAAIRVRIVEGERRALDLRTRDVQ
jgi:hypothetical protein